MPKPIILAIDDDPLVLSAVQRDLRKQYGEGYRIVGVDSGEEALGVIKEVISRGEAIALLVADQRMPGLTGVDLLEASLALVPDSKRVLLTAYADTEAAISAINRAHLDHYILKPWDPPQERLYPLLDDLLDDWRQTYRPPFQGLRVVADRWSREAHQLKEFLARNQVPYQSIDIDTNAQGALLLETLDASPADLPVVLLEDGSHLIRPNPARLAEAIGLRTRAELPFYDLVIVGGGPAGLAAAVYSASEGLSTLLVEREAPGGQAGQSARIENYLGFPVGLSGSDLTRRAVTQAQRFNAELLVPVEVTGLTRNDPFRIVTLADGTMINTSALIIATGVSYRLLDAEGADRLAGIGLYYGASAVEAQAYRDEDVFVIGGGNSAGQAAVYLAGFARSVTLVVRSSDLANSMSRYLIDRLDGIYNVVVRPRTEITALQGETRMEAITLQDVETRSTETIPASAAFVFVGQTPHTDWVAGVVERDAQGFILTGDDCTAAWPIARMRLPLESSVAGIFVAGDVRAGSIKRIASATGEGAMAVNFVHQHLASL